MKFFLLILIISGFLSVNSQEFNVLTKPQETGRPVLTKIKSIDNQGEEVEEILIDQKTHKSYYFFCTSTDSTIKNTFDGLDREIPRCGIITEEGVKLSIPDYFVDALKVYNGNLIIGSKDVVNNKSSLKKYKIQNSKLVLEKEFKFNSFFHNFEATENLIFVTDQYMEAGANIYVFDTDIEKLKEITPFPGEAYSETAIKENSEFIVSFSTSYQNPGNQHFILYDKKFNLLREKFIKSVPFELQFVRLNNDEIFVCGFTGRQITEPVSFCYDLEFNLQWDNSYNFPYWYKNIELFNNGNFLWGYINIGEQANNLFELDKETGKVKHIINIDSLYYSISFDSTYNGILTPLVVDIYSKNTLGIILAQGTREYLGKKTYYKCQALVLFSLDMDKKSIMINKLPLEFVEARPIKLIHDNKTLTIIFTNKILYYEIP